MEYRAFLKQRGEGCDYTIGCAQTVVRLASNSLEDAKIKLSELILEEYNNDETMLESAEIYEINEVIPVEVNDIYKRYEQSMKMDQDMKKEEEERKEFERLKQKYDI